MKKCSKTKHFKKNKNNKLQITLRDAEARALQQALVREVELKPRNDVSEM